MTAPDRASTDAVAARWWRRMRDWLASATAFPEATATFPRPVRRVTAALGLATVAVALAVAPTATDQVSYLGTWWVTLPVTVPAVVFSAIAARRARPAGEVTFWRRWTLATVSLLANGVGLSLVTREDTWGLRALAPVAVGLSIVLFMVCNTTLMRRRSGGRSVALDAVETSIASTLLATALAQLVGDRLYRSPVPWFTYPCIGALVGGAIGLVWVTVLFHRTPRHHRRLELIGIGLAVATIVDASLQLAQGLSGFTLPAAPAVVAHQLTLLILLLVPLHASRVVVPGLELLAPQQQVRGSRVATVLTVVAIPLLAVLALLRRHESPWVVDNFAVNATILAVLLALRALLALNETKGLYRAVAEVSEERRQLLGALTRNFDGDRHRIAAQLHQQAIASYVTFASYLQSASRLSPRGVPLPETSEQLQADLSRAAERWREFMLAVGPPVTAAAGPAGGLRVAIVAHVVALTEEDAGPALSVDVDPRLQLDWATEALVLRILQEAITHLHGVRLVTALAIAVTARDDGFEVHLTAEGAVRPAGPDRDRSPGVDAIASFVELADGELDVEHGTTQTALAVRLRRFGISRRPTPHLRVVPPEA